MGISLGYGSYPSYYPHHYASYYSSYYPYYYASYYPYYGAYGASAYGSYDAPYTYAPVVYIESQETVYAYEDDVTNEDGVTNETAALQAPVVGIDIDVRPDDDGRAFPEGVGAPRPLIEAQAAPEVLPPSMDGEESSIRLDGDGRGMSETHKPNSETGLRT